MTLFSDLPTIFHITHQKAGSTWVHQVLAAGAPERLILPHATPTHFTGQPVLPGMIYPSLYITRDEFESVAVPEAHSKFVVIRDLRDTLISLYFSFKYSHIPLYTLADYHRRLQLNARPLSEGLRHAMHLFLPKIARIQTSWINAGVLVIRYEELVQDELPQFERLLKYCRIELSPEQLRQIVKTYSFEQRSGRPRGVEDIMSHYRKGIVGDWRNYLSGELLAEFKEYYDDVLIETGYETNRDWGLAEIPRTYALANPVKQLFEKSKLAPAYSRQCWCSSDPLMPFSPDYYKCTQCGTLVCKYHATPDDLMVSNDETDLYGRNYWLAPRFYCEKQDYYQHDSSLRGNIYERARDDLASDYALKRLQLLLKYKAPGAKVLEIGCGSGALVALMQQAGFEAVGLELSPWAVELARQTFDIPVYVGPLEKQDFRPGSFDAIVLLNVIEHLPDPVGTLNRCLQLLANTGLLLIETPLFDDGRTFEALRSRGALLLNHLRPIEHLHLFTPSALQLLLTKIGCCWIDFDSQPLVVAGQKLLTQIPEAAIIASLLASPKGRLIQALLDQRHEIHLAHRRRQEDRLIAFEQLQRVLSASSGESLQTDFITTGQGWYQVETYQGETFCWIANDAELVIARPTGQRSTLNLEVEPGPGLNGQPLKLQALDQAGQIVATAAQAIGRQTVEMTLPISPGQRAVFRLHVEGGGAPTPNDPRILNFRVFRFGWD